MPTEFAKMFPVGNGADEDTSVKGGKRTRTGVAHRSRRDSGGLKANCETDSIWYVESQN